MRSKLIYIATRKFLGDFDWKRYEFNFLNKYLDIEIHDLIDFVHPGISKMYEHIPEIKKLKKFNNYNTWKKYVLNIRNTFEGKIYIIIPDAYSFKTLLIRIFLRKLNIELIEMNVSSKPEYKNNKKFYNVNYIKKIIYFFNKIIFRPKHFFASLKSNFFSLASDYVFKIYVNHKLISDLKSYIKQKKKINTNLISYNSYDYSRYVIFNKKINNKISYPYAVFLSDGGPQFPSDSTFHNTKRVENKEKWFSLLNDFFSKIESYFNVKVIIASHPRASRSKYAEYLNNRLSFYNSTLNLVKYSKFVINMASTSVSYAIIYKKPILFFYSNQQFKSVSTIVNNIFYSNILNSKSINISKFYDAKILKNAMCVTSSRYNYFKKNYLSSIYKTTPNYLIFLKKVVNLKGNQIQN
jgi:hypothetical protein